MARYGTRSADGDAKPAGPGPGAQGAGLPAPLRAAVLWLRVSLVAMALGAALNNLRDRSPVFGTLWDTFEWSEAAARGALRVAAFALLGVGVLLWWRRLWIVGVALGLYMAIAAAAGMHRAEAFWQLVPGAQAARWIAPFGLALLIALPLRGELHGWRVGLAVALLRLAAGATFVCHGIEALELNPRFVDLIQAAGRRLLGLECAASAAETALRAIGVLDIVVGLAILVLRSRTIALWMAFWGLATAISRVIESGFGATPEALLRAPCSSTGTSRASADGPRLDSPRSARNVTET